MASLEDLHKLVDTLPEGALDSAMEMLQHLQTWPPALPPEFAELAALPPEERSARMREKLFPGMKIRGSGSGSGSGSIRLGQKGYKGRRGSWSTGHGAVGDRMQENHYYFDEHEIVVNERFVTEARGLVYRHEILELGGQPEIHEVIFPFKHDPNT